MIKAIIFDRDGVLIDSEALNVKAAELTFKEFGYSLTQEEKDWIVGRYPDDYLVPLMKKYTIDYDRYRERQRAHYSESFGITPLFEDTVKLLREIHKMGVVLALCTSSNKEQTLQLLDRIGAKELFQEIVTKEDYTKRKPDPEPYLVTAERLNVEPKNCMVIEDSEIGLKSALSAGMKCIVIFNEYTKGQDFTGALKVVSSADEIDIQEVAFGVMTN